MLRLGEEIKILTDRNEEIFEDYVSIKKEIMNYNDLARDQPLEKGGTGGPTRGNKELIDLMEIMKQENDNLIDQV